MGNGLDRPFELHAAGESVEGVGGHNDDAALLKEVDNTPNFALIGIVCIYSSYHLLKLQKYEVFLNCYTFFIEISFYRCYEEMYRIVNDALRALAVGLVKCSKCRV